MYKNGERVIDRILELANKCPKELQEKCFEILLAGYVQFEVSGARPQPLSHVPPQGQQTEQQPPSAESQVPSAVLPRFKNTAKRLGVTLEKLEALFDFSVDPFALHALTVPGKNNAEKTRRVALLAASRSYLAVGRWTADWQEVKTLCVDQGCYDAANHAVSLKKGTKTIFKNAKPGEALVLSTAGIQQAQELLKTLVG